MKTSTLSGISALIMLVGVLAAPNALAQVPLPESSTWTITEATDVGGTILQPGTYRIAIVPRDSDRNLLRVTSVDGQTLYTTVLTVPHQLEPGEEMPNTMFVFYPAAAGQTRALRTWFPADAPSGGGHDIVYEESRARALASAADTRVVYYPAQADLETTEVQVVTPDSRVETYVVPPAPRVTVVEPRPRTVIAETRTELPATGSRTPFVALLGLLAVAAALVIRVANR